MQADGQTPAGRHHSDALPRGQLRARSRGLRSPARHLLAAASRAIEAQHLLELLAALLRDGHRSLRIARLRHHLLEVGAVVPAERVGDLARLVRSTPSDSSTWRPVRSADSNVSRSTSVTPRRAQLDVVRDVARPRDDRQVGKVLAHEVGERKAVGDVVDRVDQQASPSPAPAARSRSSRVASP